MAPLLEGAKLKWPPRPLVVCCPVLVAIGMAGLFLAQRRPQSGPAEVGVGYHGRFSAAMWQRLPGHEFCLTNYTMNTLSVSVSSFQVREGANWSKHACFSPMVVLSPSGTGRLTIDFSSQHCAAPTNTWRVELCVAKKLSRPEALTEAIRRFPAVAQGVLKGTLPSSYLIRQFGMTSYGDPRSLYTPELKAYQFNQVADD
jgi:hypothetical protein